MSVASESRVNPLVEKAKAVFDGLPVQSSRSISELSSKVGISWATARNWIELIVFIQAQDELRIHKRSKGSVEYSRGGKAGRPTKK